MGMLVIWGCLLFIFIHLTNEFVFAEHNKRPQEVTVDQSFSNLVAKLWSLDKNRVVFDVDVRLSLQGRVPWYSNGRDAASYPLFDHVNKDVLQKPTYKAFLVLLDNYYRNSGMKEVVTNKEISEMYNFLHIIMNTPVMKEIYRVLKLKGKASPIFSQFKQQLYSLWFRPYYRSALDRVLDSSGFEHVFVGEINKRYDKVSGFHNWLQLYMEEKSKNLNYMGYLKKDSKSKYLLMLRFQWHNKLKVIGSCFVGVSPEFEFALYTAAYMLGYKEVTFKLDGMDVKITCHGINGGRNIGSCYPDIL